MTWVQGVDPAAVVVVSASLVTTSLPLILSVSLQEPEPYVTVALLVYVGCCMR